MIDPVDILLPCSVGKHKALTVTFAEELDAVIFTLQNGDTEPLVGLTVENARYLARALRERLGE